MSSPKRCYASQHLKLAEFGLYEILMRLTSGGKNKLFFDGRKMAGRIGGDSPSTVYRNLGSLVLTGWAVLTGGKVRKADGKMSKGEYRILDHDAWVAVHGTARCCGRNENSSPVSPVELEPTITSVRNGGHQCQNTGLPVSEIGATSVKNVGSPVPPVTHSFVNDLVEPFEYTPVSNIVGDAAALCTNPEIDFRSSRGDQLPAERAEYETASPPVPLAADDGWTLDFGRVPVDWIDHLARMAIVEVPKDAE